MFPTTHYAKEPLLKKHNKDRYHVGISPIFDRELKRDHYTWNLAGRPGNHTWTLLAYFDLLDTSWQFKSFLFFLALFVLFALLGPSWPFGPLLPLLGPYWPFDSLLEHGPLMVFYASFCILESLRDNLNARDHGTNSLRSCVLTFWFDFIYLDFECC